MRYGAEWWVLRARVDACSHAVFVLRIRHRRRAHVRACVGRAGVRPWNPVAPADAPAKKEGRGKGTPQSVPPTPAPKQGSEEETAKLAALRTERLATLKSAKPATAEAAVSAPSVTKEAPTPPAAKRVQTGSTLSASSLESVPLINSLIQPIKDSILRDFVVLARRA